MFLVAGTLLSCVPLELCPSSSPLNSLRLGQLRRAQRSATTNPLSRLLESILGQARKVRNAQQRALPRHSLISASGLGGAGIELLCAEALLCLAQGWRSWVSLELGALVGAASCLLTPLKMQHAPVILLETCWLLWFHVWGVRSPDTTHLPCGCSCHRSRVSLI